MGKRKAAGSRENNVFFVASGQCGCLYSGLPPPLPGMISLKWDILIRGLDHIVLLHSLPGTTGCSNLMFGLTVIHIDASFLTART